MHTRCVHYIQSASVRFQMKWQFKSQDLSNDKNTSPYFWVSL